VDPEAARSLIDVADTAEGSGRGPTRARQPVSLRLSAGEREAVARAAHDCGDTPGGFIRRAALAAAGRPAGPRRAGRDLLAQETARAVGQLGKIGSLINQVARVANATGRIGATDATYTYQRVSRELAATRLLLLDRDMAPDEP